MILLAFVAVASCFKIAFAPRQGGSGAVVANFKCSYGFMPANASDPTSDPNAHIAAVTDKTSSRNADCAGVCKTDDITQNPEAGKSKPADSFFCAKDADGNCARAMAFSFAGAKFSNCVLKQAGSFVNQELEFTEYNKTASFLGLGLRRSYSDDYSCQKAITDKCTIVDACGSFHVALNKRAADNKCDANCVATGDACELFVCAKDGDTCFLYDRLATLPSKPDSCTFRGPTSCDTMPFSPVDPFVYLPVAGLATGKTVHCCGAPAASTTTSPSAGTPTTTSQAAVTTLATMPASIASLSMTVFAVVVAVFML